MALSQADSGKVQEPLTLPFPACAAASANRPHRGKDLGGGK